ncbi:MAG: VWA domain-containing protein [Candidatus Altiarchaeota archaeon]|nr:VWA domain-containing protein [Candidatus Altiarchaeota archaeon]
MRVILISIVFLSIITLFYPHVFAQSDNPPVITDFYASETIVLIGDIVTLTAEAGDDLGVSEIYFSTPTTPSIPKNCVGNPLTCTKSIDYQSAVGGTFEFCSWARDTAGQSSPQECIDITFVSDKPPKIAVFEADPNPAYKGAKVNFTIEAGDDLGVKMIYLEELSTGVITECQCLGIGNCSSDSCVCLTEPCFIKEFPITGKYKFCSWAIDSIDQMSEKNCLNVSVIIMSKCEPIIMDDTERNVTIATRIETKKIYEEEMGFTGYPVECCPYCVDLTINISNCERIEGSVMGGNYSTKLFNPGDEITFEDLNFIHPYILCENVINNGVVVGLVDGHTFQMVDFIYNQEVRKYWFIETTQTPRPMSYIYIANSAMDSVAKLDTLDGSILCEFNFPGIGDNPSRTAVSPNGDAWVGNRHSNDVSWMDGKRCEVKARIPVGEGPRAIVVDFDGNLWVGNYGDDNVWKIDGKTGSCLIGDHSKNPTCPPDKPPIKVGDGPYGGVVDCKGHLWIICNRYDGDDRLYKIRMSDGVDVSPPGGYRIGGDGYGIGINSKGDVWLGGAWSGNVYKINGETGAVMCKQDVGSCTRGIAVDEDDNAWTADSDLNKVHKVDTDCNLIASYSVGTHPIGVASDFNRNMWVICRESHNAYKLKIDDGTVLDIYPTSGFANPHPYCYSDMTGYGLYHACFNKTSHVVRYEDKYFLAEELVRTKDETKSIVIVDSLNYSNAVYNLLYKECFHKVPESIECRQLCDEEGYCTIDPFLPCPGRCFSIYNYTECIYKKYESMYERPYADYLQCHKTPLRDTAWCHQKSILPTSNIAYPWYSFTTKSLDDMTLRGLDKIDENYVDAIYNWNLNVDVTEMPDLALMPDVTHTPEAYCSYSHDNKLFRTVWAKIFTVTPYLNDNRNKVGWSRTGPGTLFAGGGFKREPACYWEDCALCGPGDGVFNSDVINTLKITIPDSVIGVVHPLYSRTSYYYTRDFLSNGPLTIISTGNIPFVVSSASFIKNEALGEYTIRLAYRPIDNTRPFNIVQDIMLDYNLTEDADDLSVEIDETFTTSLSSLTTTLSVDDFLGKTIDIVQDKIVALKEATTGFINISINQGNEVGLVAFSGDQGSTLNPPQCISGCIISWMQLTDNADALYDQINKTYKPSMWTCIACGIDRGRELLGAQTPANKTMILMSDGEETTKSHITGLLAKEAAGLAAGDGITIHTVALGDEADEETLQDIAQITGGKFYKMSCDMLLVDIYAELANKVNNVVLVSDVSKSMGESLSLSCAADTTPVIHEDILKDVEINITGKLWNTKEGLIRSRGLINLTIKPDILNRFTLNIGNSSIDYFSLIYPVKHELYRKETSLGSKKKTYTFEDSYGYENPEFNYPEQCRKICPLDCTCPGDDITDVTCPEGKRDDCVCMPPEGHSYKTPCVSDRTFHEEEHDYYDFVDLITMETDDVRALKHAGPNLLFTGDLAGNVIHFTSQKISSEAIFRILIYTTGDEPVELKNRLENEEGYLVDIIGRDECAITPELLLNYSQLWFMDVDGNTKLNESEINAVVNHHNSGRGVLLSGRNTIADRFNVNMGNTLSTGVAGCITPDVFITHPVLDYVVDLSSRDDVNLTTSNPWIDIIATVSVSGVEYPYIMVMDSTGDAGRIVFDSSVYRFIDSVDCDNYLYALNIAEWLFSEEEASEEIQSVYMLNFTAMSFPYPLDVRDMENANITVFVHFRDDTGNQTFSLLPERKEGNLYVNVTMMNPVEILYTVDPRRHDLSEGTTVGINITLMDAFTSQGIPDEEITVEAVGYDISEVLTTDGEGNARFEFQIGPRDTNIRLMYESEYAQAEEVFYLSVSNLSMLWWFLSPDVLLMVIILVLLAFSYKWFREGRLDPYSMWNELRGRK